MREGAEQAGGDEVEEAPQLAQMIFDRGTGGDYLELAVQTHGRLGPLGVHILDGLAGTRPRPSLSASWWRRRTDRKGIGEPLYWIDTKLHLVV